MRKTTLYTYLGSNGTLTTPIHLPNVYCIKKFVLDAENGKKLTSDGVSFHSTVTVSETDLDKWYEV